MVERHKHGKHLFHTLAKFGPGFGLMATLIAQVAMFRSLGGDAGAIGNALAIALTGTLYGCILQNLVAGPVAEKLGAAIAGRSLRQGNHAARRAEHSGRQQSARRGNAVAELPEHQAAGGDAQGGVDYSRRNATTWRKAKACRCKKAECEECPEWIFTFADLVMLMMGFFVILWVLKPDPGKKGSGKTAKATT